MAAPVGNTNSKSGREWKLAIKRALAHVGEERKTDWRGALDNLAHQLLKKCNEGDLAAIKELGDRIDGRPSQQVQLTSGEDEDGNALPYTPSIQVTYVSPKVVDPDASPVS